MAADKAARRSGVTGTRVARPSRPPPPRAPLSLDGLWHNVAVRGLIYQVLVLSALCGLAAGMIGNAQHVLTVRGIATGFSFLLRESGFPINPSLIPYSAADSFMRAFAVGVLNTLSVSLASVAAATVLGVLIGIARLSRNWIIARLATVYVELFRNTPQLVQISFWYLLVTRLPPPRQAWNLAGIGFVSNRGLVLAVPAEDPVWPWVGYAVVITAVAVVLLARPVIARWRKTGRKLSLVPLAFASIVGIPALVWLVGGAPTRLDLPALQGFNFRGGVTLPPEFIALFLGLSLYIAAFIAEIVRSGIQSVGRGQIEAAHSIGLGRGDLYRSVILPQALRVIIPPAASQYVSLFKNSSLGVAIGYPELFNISNTVTTLSGHAIECVLIMAGTYLLISLTVAILMNAYNRAIQIKEH